jgi:hypothetical protein
MTSSATLPPEIPKRPIAADMARARNRKLHRSGQAVLYDIQARVRAGYFWWMIGEVTAEQIVGLVARMAVVFGTDDDSLTRHRNKQRAEARKLQEKATKRPIKKEAPKASSVLFVWPLRNDPAGVTTRFGWLMLSTEHIKGQVMYDGRRQSARVNLYANTNAVYHLKATEEKATSTSKKLTFTWQLSAQSLEFMRARFATEAGSPAALARLRGAYLALPMTSGYRRQLKEVLVDTREVRARIHTPKARAGVEAIKVGDTPDPLRTRDLPFVSGFVTYFEDPPVTLGAYLDAVKVSRKELERCARQRVQADHAAEPV